MFGEATLDDGIPVDLSKWVTRAGNLEDIPQLAFQVAFVLRHRSIEEHVVLAFTATVICIAFRCLYKSKGLEAIRRAPSAANVFDAVNRPTPRRSTDISTHQVNPVNSGANIGGTMAARSSPEATVI